MRTDDEILREIETADEGAGPDPAATITDPALIAVYQALTKVASAEAALDRAVKEARAAGYTWQTIGDVVGMTRQGALKRFAA